MKTLKLTLLAILLAATALLLPAAPVGTAFTYQGRLNDAGQPANGSFDFKFSLYEVAGGGSLVGGPVTNSAIIVSNGLFTVTLDFGGAAFDGGERWLEIGVRPGLSTGEFSGLTPRQSITVAPYAIWAAQLSGTLTPANITNGTITAGMLANDGDALSKVSAGTMTMSGGLPFFPTDVYLRGDLHLHASYNGIGYYGGGEPFDGRIPLGPIVYGENGGILGTKGSGEKWTLHWFRDGHVAIRGGLSIDNELLSNGTVAKGLTFGGSGSGEGIASTRTGTANLNGLDLFTSYQPRLSIDNSGRVGIGTTAPTDALLDVEGNIRLNDNLIFLRGASDRNHALGWFGTERSFAGLNVDGPVLYGWSGGGLGSSNPTNRLALGWDNAGKVYTDPAGQNNGNLTPGLTFGPASGEGISSKRTSGGNQFGLDFYTGHNIRMTITSSGNVGIGRQPTANRLEVEGNASKTTAGSWLANSDARIKTEITSITNALETLERVRPVRFRYTENYRAAHPSIEDRDYVNVVAQEFQEVFPESVKPSGERLADGSEILQVDTYPLTIYTAAAVQELRRELQAKDAEIQALKQRLEALERRLVK